MGPSVKQENGGVVKLVHPGGLVEIHTTPITAAQVMKMNPRHCVARPDVFKYPWIVVRPESVLTPATTGSLFYIVPYHTMRKLMLKAQKKEHQQQAGNLLITPDSAKENKTFKGSVREKTSRIFKHGIIRESSRVACYDQSATDYASVDLSRHFNSMKQISPWHRRNSSVIDTDESFGSKASVLSVCSELIINSNEEATNVNRERKQQAAAAAAAAAVTPNIRVVQRKDDREADAGLELLRPKEINSRKDPRKLQLDPLDEAFSVQRPIRSGTTVPITENSNRVTALKSCLKTPETTNTRASNLRVRFMLPGDEEENIMRTRSCGC